MNPCRDCTERAQGCHSKCEAYKAWRAEYSEATAALRQRYNDESLGVLVERARRSRRDYRKMKRK